MGLRGGVGRTRTSNQAVIVKEMAKHVALPTSTDRLTKRRASECLSGKLSDSYLGDQLNYSGANRANCIHTLKSNEYSCLGRNRANFPKLAAIDTALLHLAPAIPPYERMAVVDHAPKADIAGRQFDICFGQITNT
jgi:hypothetical protein